MPDRNHWARTLAEACGARIRLPRDIAFSGRRDHVDLTLSPGVASANMQTDAAAVEAWSLALLTHGGVKSVGIDLANPGTGPHHERLLYRLAQFAELFPAEVMVRAEAASCRARLEADLQMNRSAPRLGPKPTWAMVSSRLPTDISACRSESDLEVALEHSPAFRQTFGLQAAMRQWPVGVFAGPVAKANLLFTGGKSAIDLIGLSHDALFLFELKTAFNRKLGALAELLFYVGVMRDALGAAPRFRLPPVAAAAGCEIGPLDVVAAKRIEAVLLAPDFHPLITGALLRRLNGALAATWSERPVRIRCARIVSFKGGDFVFGAGP